MAVGKETVVTESCGFLLNILQFVGVSRHNRIHITEVYSNLGSTKVEYVN